MSTMTATRQEIWQARYDAEQKAKKAKAASMREREMWEDHYQDLRNREEFDRSYAANSI
jgi:lambda repressor-like predicted transcriptional regulator